MRSGEQGREGEVGFDYSAWKDGWGVGLPQGENMHFSLRGLWTGMLN